MPNDKTSLKELQDAINELDLKFNANYTSPEAIIALEKTLASFNITIQEWNLLISYIHTYGSTLKALKQVFPNILKVLDDFHNDLDGRNTSKDTIYTGESIVLSDGTLGTQTGDTIPGGTVDGVQSYALGGTRYDYINEEENNFDRTPTSVDGNQSMAVGGSVHVNGDWSFACCKDNETYQKLAFAAGGGNKVGQTEEEFNALWNWHLNENGQPVDSDNKTYENSDSLSAVFGETNIVTRRAGFAAGSTNRVERDYSAAFGRNNEITAAGGTTQFVCGYYNLNNADDILEIGNGSNSQRSNAFYVTKEGKAYVNKSTTITDADNILTTKDFTESRYLIEPGGGVNNDSIVYQTPSGYNSWKVISDTAFWSNDIRSPKAWSAIMRNYAGKAEVATPTETDSVHTIATKGYVDDGLQNVVEVAEGKNKSLIITATISKVFPTRDNFQPYDWSRVDGSLIETFDDFVTYVTRGEYPEYDLDCINDSILNGNDRATLGIMGYNYIINHTDTKDIVIPSWYIKENFKVGDLLLITETDVPDWWISSLDADTTTDMPIFFNKLETTKVDLDSKVTKFDATGLGTKVYTAKSDGTDGTYALETNAYAWSIPSRDGNGCIKTGTPTADNDCATKGYVDSKLGIWVPTAAPVTTTITSARGKSWECHYQVLKNTLTNKLKVEYTLYSLTEETATAERISFNLLSTVTIGATYVTDTIGYANLPKPIEGDTYWTFDTFTFDEASDVGNQCTVLPFRGSGGFETRIFVIDSDPPASITFKKVIANISLYQK